MKRLRFWVVLYLCCFFVVAYTLFPRRTDLWLQIRIGNQDWEELKEVQLAVSDRSRQFLVTATLDLSTSYDNGLKQLSGHEGWYDDVAEKIVEGSKDGLLVSISAPGCKRSQFEIRRRDIDGSYDFPYLQLGGHGTGYHDAAMHYRSSHRLDLDCQFASPDTTVRAESMRN